MSVLALKNFRRGIHLATQKANSKVWKKLLWCPNVHGRESTDEKVLYHNFGQFLEAGVFSLREFGSEKSSGFMAISAAVMGTPDNHKLVRQAMVRYLRSIARETVANLYEISQDQIENLLFTLEFTGREISEQDFQVLAWALDCTVLLFHPNKVSVYTMEGESPGKLYIPLRKNSMGGFSHVRPGSNYHGYESHTDSASTAAASFKEWGHYLSECQDLLEQADLLVEKDTCRMEILRNYEWHSPLIASKRRRFNGVRTTKTWPARLRPPSRNGNLTVSTVTLESGSVVNIGDAPCPSLRSKIKKHNDVYPVKVPP